MLCEPATFAVDSSTTVYC